MFHRQLAQVVNEFDQRHEHRNHDRSDAGREEEDDCRPQELDQHAETMLQSALDSVGGTCQRPRQVPGAFGRFQDQGVGASNETGYMQGAPTVGPLLELLGNL